MEAIKALNNSRALRGIVAVLCTYEAVAITTQRMPTITAIQARRPAIGAALVAVLAAHFIATDESS